jgi:hypothetical protein
VPIERREFASSTGGWRPAATKLRNGKQCSFTGVSLPDQTAAFPNETIKENRMFRALVVLAFLAVAAFMAGWFTVDRDEKETTIRFNRDEIRADASKAIAKGKELLQKTGQDADNDVPGDQYQAYPDQTYPNQTYPNQTYPNQGTYPSGYPNVGAQQGTSQLPPWEQASGGAQQPPPRY